MKRITVRIVYFSWVKRLANGTQFITVGKKCYSGSPEDGHFSNSE